MPDYYVDASSSINTGTGPTPETARQYLGPVIFFLNRTLNQNIWLRAGYFYDVASVGASIPGIVASHVKIRRYGDPTAGNPCLDGRNWVAPGSKRFTYVGSANGGGHVWKLQVGTASVIWRLWSKAVNNGPRLQDRTIGVALRRSADATGQTETAIRAALGPYTPWHGSDTTQGYRLYMWSPSSEVDPADYFGGIAFLQSGAGTTGFDYGLNIRNSQDILIDGVDVAGPRLANYLIGVTDTDAVPCMSIRIKNCNAILATVGFNVRSNTTATGIANNLIAASDILFENCVADTSTSPDEQEEDNATHSRLSGASDLFYFTGRIENVRAERCRSINGFHCGATFGALDANSSTPRKTGFRKHYAIADDWATYTRAYVCFACEDSCFIDQCVADNMNVRMQFVGGVLVTSPVVINHRRSVRKIANTDGHIAIESGILDGQNAAIGNERYVYLRPTNVRIYNPTFCPCYGTPIQFNAYITGTQFGIPASTFDSGTVTIRNMVLLDTEAERQSLPAVLVYAETSKDTIAIQNIDNCTFYKNGAVSDISIQLSGVGTTVMPITSAPGFTSIMTSNPLLDATLRPIMGSPLIGASKKSKDGAKFDNTGRARPINAATMGAYEYLGYYNRTPRT